MKDVDIRFITESEKERLENLYSELIKKEFHYPENVKNFYITGEYRDRMMNIGIQIGAFLDEEMIGFILSEKPTGGVMYVPWIAVKKEYQKLGIGKKLISFIEEYALEVGVHDIRLEASDDVKDYYIKLGYRIFGYDEKGYFGQNHHYLKKLLQEPKEEHYLK